MRPASEIHSSLEMVESEISSNLAARMLAEVHDQPRPPVDKAAMEELGLVRDVLRWVAGAHWTDLSAGRNPWLVAYLLDDPPKIDNTPAEEN